MKSPAAAPQNCHDVDISGAAFVTCAIGAAIVVSRDRDWEIEDHAAVLYFARHNLVKMCRAPRVSRAIAAGSTIGFGMRDTHGRRIRNYEISQKTARPNVSVSVVAA
jgi:hypothetical protein